jgi:formate C-acetyltransferase
MKFQKSVFVTEKGMESFIALAKTYFALGGQQLSINVVSKEELLDAKVCPERHKDLIVRVGGYSDYFNNLEEGLKDNIIERTMHGL